MKFKRLSIVVILALAVSMCFVLPVPKALAATITSTATGGDWATGGTWVGGGAPVATDDVVIATTGAGAVTTSAGTITCNSLVINSGSVLTMWRPFIVTTITNISGTINFGSANGASRLMTFTGAVTLNSGANWNETTTGAAATFAFANNFTNNATIFTAQNTAHGFSGSGMTLSGSTATVFPTVTFTGNYTNSGTLTSSTLLTVTGAAIRLTNNGTITATTALSGTGGITQGTTGDLHIGGTSGITTLTATAAGNTVNYAGSAQTVKATTYDNLTLSGSGAKTIGAVTVNNILSMEGTATASAAPTYGAAATLQYNTATARTAGPEWISPFAATGGIIIANTGTITMNSAEVLSASVPLIINNGATLDVSTNNYALTLGGNFSKSGTFTARNGTVTFNGTSTQVLGGTSATTFNNLTLNNASGLTLGNNENVNGTLAFTSGKIATGANTLILPTTATVTGVNASNYVNGKVQRAFTNASPSFTFPIGDTSLYDSLTLTFTGITTGGNVTASVTESDCSAIGTSGIDSTESINHCWTLTNASTVFTSYAATFNYGNGSDVDSGATPANFIAQRYNGSTWSTLTLSGTPSGTSTSVSSVTAFGDFAIGEPPGLGISGTVFEDINYGGGAGRSLAGSSGAPVANVRVELYSNTGVFLSSTTTNAIGIYRFSRTSGTYTVRVSSNGATGIRSTRTGGTACTTCVPVQTYRTDATSGAVVAVTDHVGGQTPTLVDAADNTTSATLASLTTATTTAQSITTVAKSTTNITGVDFGFNFDTIVSIRDAGQGSLRQFIVNVNGLGSEGSLTQVGQTAGQETSIFMIPHATAVPGQNTVYADQLTSGGANNGAAVITLTSGVLPTIIGNNVSLDATTQTTNVGDTNSGTVGTGGTVGTMAQTLQPFNRPEVVISAAATQLTSSGTTVIIKGLAIANGGITMNGNNSQVRDCLSGMNADGTVTTVYGGNFAIQCGAGTGILISHNYTKVNNSSIRGDSPGANLTIEYNEIDAPNGTPGGGHTNTFDGILVVGTATNVTVRYNLIRNQRGGGLEYGFAGGTVISGTAIGNTITSNGFVSAGTRSAEPIGLAIWQLNATSALTIKQNVVTGNAGPGIVVIAATNVTITQNSIFSNGSLATDIGIDLNTASGDPNTYTAQGVTLNDMNDADTGPNNLLNYPIIDTAIISGGNLILKGWARPGSVIEFFISDSNSSGFGSGKTYLTTLTEGSGADTDATSSTYGPGAINGILQGTDNTNRFQFTIPIPAGVSIGTVLTSTATLAGNTSEFSGNVTVTGVATLTVVKSADKSSVVPGNTITYTITITNTGAGTATNVVATDPVPTYTTYVANSTRLNGITVAGDGVTSPLIAGLLIDDNASRGAGVVATGILPPHSGSVGVATVIFKVTVN